MQYLDCNLSIMWNIARHPFHQHGPITSTLYQRGPQSYPVMDIFLVDSAQMSTIDTICSLRCITKINRFLYHSLFVRWKFLVQTQSQRMNFPARPPKMLWILIIPQPSIINQISHISVLAHCQYRASKA